MNPCDYSERKSRDVKPLARKASLPKMLSTVEQYKRKS